MGTGRKKGPGGGGTSLNFDVNAYATEAELLAATPKENTIGVVTTTAISGWVFDVVDPAEPVAGTVYITTDIESNINFNALRKNILQVYPRSATQYVGEAWVDIPAYIYKDGEWKQFDPKTYIFKSGEGAKVEYLAYKNDNSTITVGTDSIKTDTSSSEGGYYTLFRTKEKIDLSKHTTLYMKCTPSALYTNDYYKDWFNSVGFTSTAVTTSEPSSNIWTARTKITASSTEKIITVDVTSITTSLYFAFQCTGNMTVTDIWLE